MAGGGHGGGAVLEEEHEEHQNHEAWVIPYADMVTLLMALFLMLYAISTIDLKKFEQLAQNLNSELGGGGSGALATEGGSGVLSGAGPSPLDLERRREQAEAALAREERTEQARAAEATSLAGVEERIAADATRSGVRHAVGFRQEARGLVVTLVADDVVFEPGSARLRVEGAEVLRQVGASLRTLPNQLLVEGHTDDRPIATSEFPSNWELSTERATSVLRFLTEQVGIDAARLAAAGYGDRRPLRPNSTAEGRAANRRVEIAVLATEPAGPSS